MRLLRVVVGVLALLLGLGFALVGVMSMGDGTTVILSSLVVAAIGTWLVFSGVARR